MCETLLAMVIYCAAGSSPAIAERTEFTSLDNLLKTWEVQSHKGRVVQIEFTRFIYDTVFKVEKRAKGRLIFGAGRFRFDSYPSEYEKGETSRRTNQRTQTAYKLAPSQSETWIGDSKTIRWIRHSSRRIDVFPTPRSNQLVAVAEKPKDSRWDFGFRFPAFWDDYVPTFLRVNAEDLHQRFFIRLENTEKAIIFTMRPRGEPDSFLWRSLNVMWDDEHQRMGALKIIDPSGNLETVYVVKSYQIDPRIDAKATWDPDYPGYSVQTHPPR